jgi:galactofuranose transport system permease protein
LNQDLRRRAPTFAALAPRIAALAPRIAALAPTITALAPTIAALVLISVAAVLVEPRIASPRVAGDLVADGAMLGVAAIGATIVLVSGGIDLSVGALAALASTTFAWLVETRAIDPYAAAPLVLAGGAVLGAGVGFLVDALRLPAFLVTLAAMFLYRGLALSLSAESLSIGNERFVDLASASVSIAGAPTLRAAYAIGGDEHAARLAGVPLRSTRVVVYALSGAASTLAGLVYALVASSGSAVACTGLELDAIAAAVVGGVSLQGGVGGVGGAALGVLVFGVIQVTILFTGSLDGAWTRVVWGALLLGFLALRRGLDRSKATA